MEMRFKIKEIPALGAPLRVKRQISQELLTEVLQGTGGEASRSTMDVELELMRDHDTVIAHGRVRGTLDLPCSRCLESAQLRTDAPIDLLFTREGHPTDRDAAAAADEDEADDLDAPDSFFHDGVSFSLDDALRELLIAELPISTLCQKGCRGLCVSCGANQNTVEGRA